MIFSAQSFQAAALAGANVDACDIRVSENESRAILTAGNIREGFDDAHLGMLILAMPISWESTLQQYVGPSFSLHDNKRFVQVYDYVDNYVLMLAKMYEAKG